jgi:CMP-N-acetylneuraminic acid synthetase
VVGRKPLIAHTIEQAERSTEIDHAIVSSEDDEIRATAERFGGNVPFRRPDELASDDATNVEVVEHALDWAEKKGTDYRNVCLLQVTSPFRSPEDIDGALRELEPRDAKSVVTTCEFETPPFWAVTEDQDGYLSPYFGDDYLWSKTQTQSVPTLTHPNGAVFAARTDAFRDASSFYTDKTVAYKMPRERSLDIDDPIDLRIARSLEREEDSE